MAMAVTISQKQQKISISLLFKCDLSQANTPVDISMVIKKTSLLLTNSCHSLCLRSKYNNANAVSIHNIESYIDFSIPSSEKELLIVFR